MLIETSKDLLYVVLAFCVLWLTVFMSWLLYYVIAIIRDAEALVSQIKGAVSKVDQLAHIVQERVERSASSLSVMAQAVKEIIVWAIQERSKMASSERKSSKKK